MSKEKFFKRNVRVIDRVVRNFLAKNKVGIIHGSRAANVQLPKNLNVQTRDFDVFVRNPEKRAAQVEKILDRRFRGDFFSVKRGATEKLRVNKVISNVTGKSHVDFSVRDRVIPTVSKRGLKFATLKDQVARAKQNIQDPSKEFRREKDISLIRRARQFNKKGGKLNGNRRTT